MKPKFDPLYEHILIPIAWGGIVVLGLQFCYSIHEWYTAYAATPEVAHYLFENAQEQAAYASAMLGGSVRALLLLSVLCGLSFKWKNRWGMVAALGFLLLHIAIGPG